MNMNYYEGFEIIILFMLTCCVIFGLYIGMVLEPECEQKGYAGIDSKGCFIIQQGEKVYEKAD